MPAPRPECDSNANLARAARDHKRQQRVDADDRQQQRHAAHRRQCGRDAGEEYALLPTRILERTDILELQIRIDVGHRRPQRCGQGQRIRGRTDDEVPQQLVLHRRVETRSKGRIADAQTQVGDHADNFAPRRHLAALPVLHADAPADWIPPAEELAHERLIDNGHRCGAHCEIGRREQAPRHGLPANRFEKPLSDGVTRRRARRDYGLVTDGLDRYRTRRWIQARQVLPRAGCGNTRQRPDRLDHAVACFRLPDAAELCSQHLVLRQRRYLVDVRRERARHRHRAVQERDRERNLQDQQHRTHRAEAARREPAAGLQRVSQIVPGDSQRRNETGHGAHEEGQEHHERHDAPVQLQRDPEWPALERRPDVVQRTVRGRDADRGGDRAKQQRLDENLRHDARARGAERGAHRQLRRACPRAREDECRHVARDNQQHHDEDADERRHHHVAVIRVRGKVPHQQARLLLRSRRGVQLPGQPRHFRRGLLKGCARTQHTEHPQIEGGRLQVPAKRQLVERQPELRRIRKLKRVGHDADHGPWHAANRQLPADDVGAGVVAPVPETLANQHDVLGALFAVGRNQGAADDGRRVEPAHRARRDHRSPDRLHFVGAVRERERPATSGADMLERLGAITERVIPLQIERGAVAFAVEDEDSCEALARRIRQRAVDQLVPQRKPHRCEADAGRQREDDRD